MPDQFTEVTTASYGSRIINSLKEMIFGLIIFIASFILLYWNEGRSDLSNIAKTATEINSTSAYTAPTLQGKVISTTGQINSDQIIGDNLFLKPNKYISITRGVEMYSWVEKSKSGTIKNIGGSETTKTTYTYSKEWVENPQSSGNFKHPTGHENPEKGLGDYANKVTATTIGVYSFDPQNIILPDASPLALNSQNITLNNDNAILTNNHIFIKKSNDGTFNSPQIGDLRVNYYTLRSEFEGTIFGKLNGNKIDPYFDQKGNKLYRLFNGTREQGIYMLRSEYQKSLWGFRLVGFLLMWFGLYMLFNPISILLDILPIFGTISSSIIAVITVLVALLFSSVTILVSMILHNLIALLIALIINAGVIIIWIRLKKNKNYKTFNPELPNLRTPWH